MSGQDHPNQTDPTQDHRHSLNEDIRRLHALGYAQELARRLGAFSNYAISLSIICILAGGVTSFHLGLCSVGGASIGIGWALVACFSLCVAATMGHLASAYHTAGGLYHWASILGGRGWGWATADAFSDTCKQSGRFRRKKPRSFGDAPRRSCGLRWPPAP